METLVDEAVAEDPAVAGASDAAVKSAMLSVYYASIGDQFDVSGAPSAFVPPEVAPQPLADALRVLSSDPDKLEQALWQIVRNTPIRQADAERSRYRPEVVRYLSEADQDVLDRRRSVYRTGASLVAACLRACHHDDKDLLNALIKAADDPTIVSNEGFRRVVELLYAVQPDRFLEHLQTIATDARRWEQERELIDAIEREVGLGIVTYVERLAATAAYESFLRNPGRLEQPTDEPLTIFPVASVIRQSTSQLWTSATVTTLARGPVDGLLYATEPDRWQDGSDVIKESRYVADPFTLEPAHGQVDRDGNLQGLLYEVASMAWGQDPTQQATFRNVLNVSRTVHRNGADRPTIDVRFSLRRSISSDVLWDTRTGGITLNEGFLKVVPLGDQRWRVTSRKLLRFSDRTPNSGVNGWTDFGQMLNYLAPAALSWWVDTETYSLGVRTTQAGSAAEDGHD